MQKIYGSDWILKASNIKSSFFFYSINLYIMKKIFTIWVLLVITFSATFASGLFSLTKAQQNRLNTFIKQIKLPTWEYKLTVWNNSSYLEIYTPPKIESKIVEVEKEKIVTETKIVEVPKYIITEKLIQDPRVTTGSIIISPEEIRALNEKCIGWYSTCAKQLLESKGVNFSNP